MFNKRLKFAIRGCMLAHGEMTADQLCTAMGIWMPRRFYITLAQMIKSGDVAYRDSPVQSGDRQNRVLVAKENA